MRRFFRAKALAFGLKKCSEAAHSRLFREVASESERRSGQTGTDAHSAEKERAVPTEGRDERAISA